MLKENKLKTTVKKQKPATKHHETAMRQGTKGRDLAGSVSRNSIGTSTLKGKASKAATSKKNIVTQKAKKKVISKKATNHMRKNNKVPVKAKPPVPVANKVPAKNSVEKVLESYSVCADHVDALVTIVRTEKDYVPIYMLKHPEVTIGTRVLLNTLREELITIVHLSTTEFVDPGALKKVKARFFDKAIQLMERYMPDSSGKQRTILAGCLIHEMVGLGDIELLLEDPYLEEIVVNSHKDPIWVYHKRYGWLKTNVMLPSEEAIYNYSSSVGRHVGRQITNLAPLMDAHLTTGDRVNATLFPISTDGNTLTIRKFSRSPWTIIHFLEANTLSPETAAILWLAMQYELNILVAGGTASGKTSMLNVLLPFIPPNQRIISIEDTREINLPEYLHWVPFSSRGANPEGKGEVTMLDLLVNSLRMRPDRIIIGEIRRTREAEVMFEAIRTGHSAYATFHADNAEQVYKRLINPPMNLPESVLGALHLIVVQYRHRRRGIRRTTEIAEVISLEEANRLNIIYRWNPRTDKMEKNSKIIRMMNEINMYTGMTETDFEEDIQNKIAVLNWMRKNKVKTIDSVGKVFAEYYKNEKRVITLVKKNASVTELLGSAFSDELLKKSA